MGLSNFPLFAGFPLLAGLAFLTFAGTLQAQLTIAGFNGATASAGSDGKFAVSLPLQNWQFQGTAGGRAVNLHTGSGSDMLGLYEEISFSYNLGTGARAGSIRAYAKRPLLMFGITYVDAAPPGSAFPVFTSYPANMLHVTFSGMFGSPSFPGFAPDSPWTFFDSSANSFIVSPASDYLVAATTWGSKHEIQAGISNKIPLLPAGYTHWTALVYGQGINQTFGTWGSILTDLTGKKRPASDADALLRSVSYWTDNGATYYYHMAPSMTYPETLRAVQSEMQAAGVPAGSIQLDSWFYPKGPDVAWNNHGGIWTYTASPQLFTPDLAAFHKSVNVPLVAHARWIDAKSPLRQQYAMSGNVAVDPLYWDDTAAYLQSSGVQTYEQDWLGDNAHPDFNLTDPYAFFDNMAASMARRGITMQYCMAEPKHFLQGTFYSNLTTVRSGQDGFNPSRWTEFLYSSRFASALGEYPFSDVFMSADADNLLLATLSAGPVGIGDKLNHVSGANLRLAARADGVIVKPDVPATPLDSVFVSDAQNAGAPMAASTYSDFGELRATYLVAYKRDSDVPLTIQPSNFGIAGRAYLYDFRNAAGTVIEPGNNVTATLASGAGYWILVPIGKSGIGFLGDNGHFVTMGKKRITAVTDSGKLDVSVLFAAGETSRTLFGFSPQKISAFAVSGSADKPVYDTSAQRWAVTVHPNSGGTADIRINAGMGQALLLSAPTSTSCGFRCDGPHPTFPAPSRTN